MSTTPFQIATGRLIDPVDEHDHVRGSASAPVELVEYGDYQCPYCGQAYPVVEALLSRRPEQIRFAYRHFPLTHLHPYAELAAELAEAAGVRGQFWGVHDWLFTHQDLIDPVHLHAMATGLDPSGGVVRDMRERIHSDRIHRDLMGGVRSGVNGTPTFYLNGVRHEGGYSLSALTAAIDNAVRPPPR